MQHGTSRIFNSRPLGTKHNQSLTRFAAPLAVALLGITTSGSALAVGAEPLNPDAVVEAAPAAPSAVAPSQSAAPAASPPAAPPQPSYPPSGPAPGGDQGVSPREITTARTKSGLVPLLRVGFLATGSGSLKTDCRGCDVEGGNKWDFDDASGPALEFDLLAHLSPNFRLGGGLMLLPGSEVDGDGGGSVELGTESSLMLIGEGVIDLSSRMALVLRGFVGVTALALGGDYAEAQESVCDTWEGSCSYDDTFVGGSVGVGAGILVPMKGFAFRADLLVQAYSVSGTSAKVSSEYGTATFEDTFSGSRTFIMAGLEF